MIRAEDVGRAKPFQFREVLHRALGQGSHGDPPHARAYGDQHIRLLRFGGILPFSTEEARQFNRSQVIHQSRLPPQSSGSNSDRGDRVPEVMLAIAIGALAVFPRFSPMDGGKPDEDCFGRTLLA
jgi:hypothetical protein